MKKRIIVLIVLLVLLALIIAVRLIGTKSFSPPEATPNSEQVMEPSAAPQSNPEESKIAESTPAPADNTQPAQNAGESTGGQENGTQGPVTSTPDPNMMGEITPDMTVEDEMEVGLEENTAGGLM